MKGINLKHAGTELIKSVAVFLITICLLCLLLLLTAMIPNESIHKNMAESAMSYNTVQPFAYTNGNKLNSVADNYADTILLNVSWHIGKGNPTQSAFNTRYYDGENLGENYGLYSSVVENAEANTDYTRYFHGSAAFVRLGHLFADVRTIKTAGFAVICLFIIITLAMLVKRKHYDIAVILALSLVTVQFWNLRLSLEYQPTFLICFLLTPIYLTVERKKENLLIPLSVIGGTMTAFFDFLTTETITILIPLLVVTAVRAKEERLGSFKNTLPLIAKCLIGWGLAYAATFLVKWSIASVVTGKNIFTMALGSAAQRIGGDMSSYGDTPDHILSPLVANITMAFGGKAREILPLAIGGLFCFGLVVFSVWYLFRTPRINKAAVSTFALLGALVFLRYLALFNHSYIHCFFTYRALAAPVFALFAATTVNMTFRTKKRRKK